MWETQIEFQAPGCLALLYGYLGIRPLGRKSLCLCLCFCFSNKINKIKSVIVSKRERTWWKPIDTESRYCLFRGQEVFKSWIGLFSPQRCSNLLLMKLHNIFCPEIMVLLALFSLISVWAWKKECPGLSVRWEPKALWFEGCEESHTRWQLPALKPGTWKQDRLSQSYTKTHPALLQILARDPVVTGHRKTTF